MVLLKQAIRTIEEEIADQEHLLTSPSEQSPQRFTPGRSLSFTGMMKAHSKRFARFLEKLKLEAIILREQPDQGRTIIENSRHMQPR